MDMNAIAAKNNTIITLHLDDEECGSKPFAPYGELHGDDTPCLHRLVPHVVKHQIGLHELIVLPSKLPENGVQHHIDGSAAVDEHLGDGFPIDVTLQASRTWPL
jgi:hypothetical protein